MNNLCGKPVENHKLNIFVSFPATLMVKITEVVVFQGLLRLFYSSVSLKNLSNIIISKYFGNSSIWEKSGFSPQTLDGNINRDIKTNW